MGIELPPELAAVAQKAGVHWPEADEDKMRAAAQAWRGAAHQVGGLASAADGTAQQALGAVRGGTADAARRHWDSFVAPDQGHLTTAQSGCHAAADRLEHGASQVGAAKVEIVGHLVNLAKTQNAVHEVAAGGHGQAFAGLPTAVDGTAASVAQVNNNLTQSVRLDNVVSRPDNTPPAPGPDGAQASQQGDASGQGNHGRQGVLPGVVAGTANVAGNVLNPLVPPGDNLGHQFDPSGAAHGQPLVSAPLGPDGLVPHVGDSQQAGAVPGLGRGDGSLRPAPLPGPDGLVPHVGDSQQAGAVPGLGRGDGSLHPAPLPGLDIGAHEGAPGSRWPGPPGGGGSPLQLPDQPQEVHQASAGVLDPVAPPQPAQWPGEQGGPGSGAASAAPGPGGLLGGGGMPGGGPLGGALGGPVSGGGAAPIASGGAGGATGGGAGGATGGLGQGTGAGGWTGSRPPDRPFPGGQLAGPDVPDGRSRAPLGGGSTPAPAQPDPRSYGTGQPRNLAVGPGIQYRDPSAGPGVVAGQGPQQGQQPGLPVTGRPDLAVVAGPGQIAGERTQPTMRQGMVAGAWVDASVDQQRGAPTDGRHDSIALFLIAMFPIGHLPVPANRPTRQLPPPAEEVDYAAGLRFPPQDHPDAALVDDAAVLAEVHAGRDRPAAQPGRPSDDPEVADLAQGHDPLGEAHEQDWDRRFLVREANGDAGRRAEYAWPPATLYPEGGCDPDATEAVVLDEGAELDRFGDPDGRVFGEDGTPFARRSLPPEYLGRGYHRYRVLRPLPVWRTVSAAWFGAAGGGLRYRSTYPVIDLLAMGYLADITHAETTEDAETTETTNDNGEGS